MKEPPALVGQAFLYCCGDRFSPAQLCADQRSGHSRARGPGRGGGGLVVRRATRSQGLDGVRGGRGRQGPAAGCSLGLGPPRAVPGAQPGPRSADVLFCSPDLAPLLGRGLMRENGETRTLRSRALSREHSSRGVGQVLRSRAVWQTGKWERGQGGDKRDRPSCPSYLALVMPHPPMALPFRQGAFPWRPSGAAVTGPALGAKAGRAAQGRGLSAAARGAPGQCRTVGLGDDELTWAGNPSPSHAALFPSAFPQHPALFSSLFPPLSRRDPVLHIFQK